MNEFNVGDRVRCVNAGCMAGEIVNGEIYTVEKIGGIGLDHLYLEEKAKGAWYHSFRFEHVNATNNMSIDEQLKMAQGFKYKTVIGDGLVFQVDRVGVRIKGDGIDPKGKNTSNVVQEEIKKNGFCVYVEGGHYQISVTKVKLKPWNSVVRLNGEYSAKIDGDGKITVGCQTIGIGEIEKLVETYRKQFPKK